MVQTKKSLNSRQWLNIIIIAMSFMILIFILIGRIIDNNLSTSTSEQTAPSIEETPYPFAKLTAIELPHWKVSLSQEPASKETTPQKSVSQKTITQESISDNTNTLEPTWIQEPSLLDDHELMSMLSNWKNFQPQSITNQHTYDQSFSITLTIDGQPTSWSYCLTPSPALISENHRFLLLQAEQLDLLFPEVLLKLNTEF